MSTVGCISTPYVRYLEDNSTQAALTLTGSTSAHAAGRVSIASLTTASYRPIWLDDGWPNNGFNEVELQFFGEGSDTQTATARLWAIIKMQDGSGAIGDAFIRSMGTCALALSPATGHADSVVPASNLYCDTCTFTTSAYNTATLTGHASQRVNVATAVATIADMPNPLTWAEVGTCHGVLIEFDMTGATSMNCLYRLIRRIN